ncbi:MAG: sulfotransferase domain-containing protein [Gammaproteobacteria bacterium]|nr:sulfotransferase domain-containing protein [Gammaproteobacteria bacterium]MCW8840444.1 sulfotransferase domain-containing protein [Gammaproteobacteria bacterium]MCW8959140.1 sulfotransferase domain-containing protein [Gammaproteobacteria bacterium]MCW8993305.1 sulfotransferase domain-containing protein [Gammaproteobacteria bacterium]
MAKIFINSMPKSGTNLVSRLFNISGYHYAKLGVAPTLLIGRHYLLRQVLRRSFFSRNPVIVGLDVQMPVRREWLERKFNSVKDGFYVTGHANYSQGIKNILDTAGFKTVLVIRDPCDVIVSYAHYVAGTQSHFLHEAFKEMSLFDRVRFSLDGGRLSGLDVEAFPVMLSRIDGWMKQRNVYVLKFENIVGEKGGGSDELQAAELANLGDFCGVNFDVDIVRDQLFGVSKTFRKGQIGSALQELPADLIAEVNQKLKFYINEWGYV